MAPVMTSYLQSKLSNMQNDISILTNRINNSNIVDLYLYTTIKTPRKFYTLTNNSNTIKHATASPSVVPGEHAEYFKKIECFCFSQQQINGLETKELPIQFVVDTDLPKNIKTLILSYTMFNTTDQVGSN